MTFDRLWQANGPANIIGSYRGIILDIFGVIHDGVSAFAEALVALERMQEQRLRVCLVSNSPRRSRDVVARLEAMGVQRALFHEVITSGELVYEAFTGSHGFPVDATYLHLGPAELSGLLSGLPIRAVSNEENAAFVLATGWPEDDATLDRALVACHERNLPMICANPDLEVLIGGRRVACAGVLARRYEALGGHVFFYGKPYPQIYAKALSVLGLSAAEVLAIGDSVATDIKGGRAVGLDTALVLTGVHGDLLSSDGSPDLDALRSLCQRFDTNPKYLLRSLA